MTSQQIRYTNTFPAGPEHFEKLRTFHLFPLLPAELRIQIWEMTVEARKVHLEVFIEGPVGHETAYLSSAAPAIMHACRESRNLGLYQQKLSDFFEEYGIEDWGHVWLDPDIDTVELTTTPRSLLTLSPNSKGSIRYIRFKLKNLRIRLNRKWSTHYRFSVKLIDKNELASAPG